MEHRLASFLLLKKYCPLGDCGSLQLLAEPAVFLPAEKKMAAPYYSVVFSADEMDDRELMHFIAGREQCGMEAARHLYEGFSSSLKALSGTDEITIPGIGRFFAGPSGVLQFRQHMLPEAFRPAVPAERVVRANSSHPVLVGEHETDTAAMAERLVKKNPAPWPVYRITAAALLVLSLALIVFYMNQYGVSARFGSRFPFKMTVPGPAYQRSQ